MRKTLTALIAASALLFAACGDDDDGGGGGGVLGGGDSGTETGDTGETGDNGGLPTGDGGEEEATGGGDSETFCQEIMSVSSPEEAAGVTPPDDIADAWNEVVSNPDDLESEAFQQVTEWISSNCMDQLPDDLGS